MHLRTIISIEQRRGWRSGKISAFQPQGPGFHSRFCRDWNIWRPSFPLKFTQLSILPRSVKWVPACMDCLEAAAICACICFQSAGGKLIIVKRLWDVVIRALYKCTTLLFLLFCTDVHWPAFICSNLHSHALTYTDIHLRTHVCNYVHSSALTLTQIHSPKLFWNDLHSCAFTYTPMR